MSDPRGLRGLARGAVLSGLGLGLLLAPALLWPSQAFADPPLAIDDALTLSEDATATLVDVLANDTTDDALTIIGATDPAHGTAVVAGDGQSLTYAPDANYNGLDSFDYTIQDGLAAQSTATVDVTISPVNDAPVAVDDPSVDCNRTGAFGGTRALPEDWDAEDGSGWFPGFSECGTLWNDTDVDGDQLTWEIVSQPLHGVAIAVDDWFFYNADQDYSTIAGNLPGGQWVSDFFTYRAYDGTAYSNTATMRFWIVPMNDPPSFTAGTTDLWVSEDDGAYSQSWASNISVGPAIESDQTLSFEVDYLTSPVGLFSVPPAIDATGNLTFTTAPDKFGEATLIVHAKDDGGVIDFGGGWYQRASDTSADVQIDVTVVPVADAPVAVDDAVTTNEDTPLAIAYLANDTDVDSVLSNIVAMSEPAHGIAHISGYEPDPDWNGIETFTYTVTDSDGNQDTATVTVTVLPVNDAPVADDDTVAVIEDQSTPVAVLVGDTDVDGDALNVIGASDGTIGTVTIDGDGLGVRYLPDLNVSGSDSFSYTVSDGAGGTATATVTVTIASANDPPDAVDDGNPTPLAVDQGMGPTSLALIANDSSAPDTGETLTIVGVTQPAYGVAAIVSGGTKVTYDPDGLYAGADVFTYTISDGNGLTDTATVYISVMLDVTPPVATAPRFVLSGAIGSPTVRAALAWSASDSQSGISRYELEQQTDDGAWTTIPLLTPTMQGIQLSPSAGHTYRFRVRATDGLGNIGEYAVSRVLSRR